MPGGAADWIGDGPQFEQVADVDAATRLLIAGTSVPELIVLAESRPGARAAASIDALRRLAPLARIWRLLGSWCEGEARSGQPPSGCVSTYWHQWPARWAQDVARLRDGGSPAWALPVTLSPDERLLAAAETPIERRAGLIAIYARHAQTAAALSDACRLGGYDPLVVREGQQGSSPLKNAIGLNLGATAGLSSSAGKIVGQTLLDKPAVAPVFQQAAGGRWLWSGTGKRRGNLRLVPNPTGRPARRAPLLPLSAPFPSCPPTTAAAPNPGPPRALKPLLAQGKFGSAPASPKIPPVRLHRVPTLFQVLAISGWPRQLVVWVPKGQEGFQARIKTPNVSQNPLVASQHRQQVVGATQRRMPALESH